MIFRLRLAQRPRPVPNCPRRRLNSSISQSCRKRVFRSLLDSVDEIRKPLATRFSVKVLSSRCRLTTIEGFAPGDVSPGCRAGRPGTAAHGQLRPLTHRRTLCKPASVNDRCPYQEEFMTQIFARHKGTLVIVLGQEPTNLWHPTPSAFVSPCAHVRVLTRPQSCTRAWLFTRSEAVKVRFSAAYRHRERIIASTERPAPRALRRGKCASRHYNHAMSETLAT